MLKLLNWLKNEHRQLSNGKVINKQIDKWGEILVTDYGKLRVLSFNSRFEQSRLDKSRPTVLMHHYTQAMIFGLAFVQPKHITLLGLGGGCLVRTLESLLPEAKMEVVEIRPAVVETTKTYFGLPESSNINITIDDASVYLKNQHSQSTDIIFADMFHAHGVDPLQTQIDFLNQCHRLLNADGWLVLNYHEIKSFDASFTRCLKSLFEEVLICPVPDGNVVVYAGKSWLNAPLEDYYQTIEKIQKQSGMRLKPLYQQLKYLDSDASQAKICSF